MTDMSPLGRFLLRLLRTGALLAVALLAIFFGLALWQAYVPGQGFVLTRQDYWFLGIIAGLGFFALYLVRAMGRELDDPGA
jgi:hypothetical protein